MKFDNGERLLRSLVSEILLERKKRRRKKRNKPGGGLTDLGALKRVSPGRFVAKVKAAVETADGDVDQAAAALDAAPRTVYYWMEDPSFSDIKIAKEKQREKEEKEEREKEREKEKAEKEKQG